MKTLEDKVPLKVLVKEVPLEIILQALNIFGKIKSILLECLLFIYLNKSLKLTLLIWAVLHDVKMLYDKKLCNTSFLYIWDASCTAIQWNTLFKQTVFSRILCSVLHNLLNKNPKKFSRAWFETVNCKLKPIEIKYSQ